MYRKFTNEELILAVKTSFTKGEVLKKLNYNSKNSGNYATIDKYIRFLEIDISHFKSETHANITHKKRA